MQAVDLLENGVLLSEHGFQLEAEDLLVQQILHADALAGGLVLIARSDAALRRANFVFAETLLIRTVEVLVVRHDDVRITADFEVLAGDSLGLEHGHLFDKHAGVHHHAVTDDRHRVLVHDTGRHQVQRQLLVAVVDRVAGVVAALVTHHKIVLARDQIGDLAFAFVPPLSADQNRAGHTRRVLSVPRLRGRGNP